MPEESLSGFFEAWEVYRDPVLTGAAAGALLGLLGVYIVLRRMVFLAASLAQIAALGVALAFLLALPPLAGAVGLTSVATTIVARARGTGGQRREGLLGLLFLTGAAGTLAVGSRITQELHEIDEILLGSAVAVLPEDASLVLELALLLLVLHGWLWRGFAAVSFDRDGAKVRELPVALLEVGLFASLAVAIGVTTWVVGALPTFAFSVLPALAALRVTANVPRALLLASLLGAATGFAGYMAAFLWALPVGAAQTVFGVGLVLLAELGRAGRAALHRGGAASGTLPLA